MWSYHGPNPSCGGTPKATAGPAGLGGVGSGTSAAWAPDAGRAGGSV